MKSPRIYLSRLWETVSVKYRRMKHYYQLDIGWRNAQTWRSATKQNIFASRVRSERYTLLNANVVVMFGPPLFRSLPVTLSLLPPYLSSPPFPVPPCTRTRLDLLRAYRQCASKLQDGTFGVNATFVQGLDLARLFENLSILSVDIAVGRVVASSIIGAGTFEYCF